MQNTLPLFEGLTEQGLTEQGLTEQGLTEQGLTEQGLAEQALADQMRDLPVNDLSVEPRQGSGAPSNPCPTARGNTLRTTSASFGSTSPEQHLQAARRLSRRIRRYPDGSVEQTRAGLAICRHLQALLAQSDHRAGQP